MTKTEVEDRKIALGMPSIKLVRKNNGERDSFYISRVEANASPLIKAQIESDDEVGKSHNGVKVLRRVWNHAEMRYKRSGHSNKDRYGTR